MGIRTINDGGTRIFKRFAQEHKEARSLENDIDQMKKRVATDPDLSPQERKDILAKLENADSAAERAQDLTSTKKINGGRDDKFDKDERVIDNNLNNAERLLYEAMGEYTDARGASGVDKPKYSAMSDTADAKASAATGNSAATTGETSFTTEDGKVTADSSIKETTTPKLPSGEAFSVASNPNVSASDIAKNIQSGSLNLSGSDLRALASSDPKKFQEIMSELSKLPGGEETAMRLNQDMQNSLQKMNRMFSLLSNITQALHDTQKALINNIRV